MTGSFVRPLYLAVLLWVVSFGILGYAIFSSTERVRDATPPATSGFDLFGMPLMLAFRRSTGIGMEFRWGSGVLLVGPLLLSSLAALFLIARRGQPPR